MTGESAWLLLGFTGLVYGAGLSSVWVAVGCLCGISTGLDRTVTAMAVTFLVSIGSAAAVTILAPEAPSAPPRAPAGTGSGSEL